MNDVRFLMSGKRGKVKFFPVVVPLYEVCSYHGSRRWFERCPIVRRHPYPPSSPVPVSACGVDDDGGGVGVVGGGGRDGGQAEGEG